MVFGTKARLNKQEREIKVQYNSQKINVTKTYKYIGVTLDESLCLNHHFNMVCKKVATRIRLLRKIRAYITDAAALRIYQAFITPIVTYCSPTNFYHHPLRKSSLVNFEDRIKRITKSNIPSLLNLCEKKVCLTVFKSLDETIPDFADYFQRITHNIGTRNNGISLKLPKCKLESTKKAFFSNGASLFNQLPINIRSENDISKFTKQLNKFYNLE